MAYSSAPMLNLVVIRVGDLDVSQTFYNILGITFDRHRHGSGPEHLSAQLGAAVFELYPAREGQSSATTRLGFAITHLDDIVTQIQNSSIGSVVSLPADSPWGRRAVVRDPDGHAVELVAAPHS